MTILDQFTISCSYRRVFEDLQRVPGRSQWGQVRGPFGWLSMASL
jgi:hypothetical protein